MSYENYYTDQARKNTPVFRGSSYQKGYGFGDVFKRFFKWIVPIVRENAKPIVKRVGREALKTAVNIANDTIGGDSIKESAKKRITESLSNITSQSGNGMVKNNKKVYKRKRSLSKNKSLGIKKRKLDIFDNYN